MKKSIKLVQLVVNYLFTHIYFYVVLFFLQTMLLICYFLNFVGLYINIYSFAVLVQLLYFIHAFFGIITIIEDYIFNNYIRIIFVNVFVLIGLKLVFVLIDFLL